MLAEAVWGPEHAQLSEKRTHLCFGYYRTVGSCSRASGTGFLQGSQCVLIGIYIFPVTAAARVAAQVAEPAR